MLSQAIFPQYVPHLVLTTVLQNIIFTPMGFALLEKGKADMQEARLAKRAAKSVPGEVRLEGEAVLADAAHEHARARAAQVRKMNVAKLVWNVMSTPVVGAT